MSRRAPPVLLMLLLCCIGVSAYAARALPQVANVEAKWQAYANEAESLSVTRAFPYQHCFARSALVHQLPETLLLAVARGESDFDPQARSKANARGLMQILWPGTARHLGIHDLKTLHDPCTNVDAGARYLKELMTRYDNNVHLTLAAYNYGPHRIRQDGQGVPKGASWYSGYILRHMNYVLGRSGGGAGTAVQASDQPYSKERKLELAMFSAPFRAEAFTDRMSRAAPSVRLDWFRTDVDEFRVVLLYASDLEYDKSSRYLKLAGFPLPKRKVVSR